MNFIVFTYKHTGKGFLAEEEMTQRQFHHQKNNYITYFLFHQIQGIKCYADIQNSSSYVQFMTVMSTHQSDFLETFPEVPLNTAIPSITFETPQDSVNKDDTLMF